MYLCMHVSLCLCLDVCVYISLCAESGDLRSWEDRRSKSQIEVSLEECADFGPRPGSENKIQKGLSGRRRVRFCTGAAKKDDFESKIEFRSRFRKLGVNLCAQARRFRRIRQTRRVYVVFSQTVKHPCACRRKRTAAGLVKLPV